MGDMLIQKLRQVGFTIHIVPREVVGNIFLGQISVMVVVIRSRDGGPGKEAICNLDV